MRGHRRRADGRRALAARRAARARAPEGTPVAEIDAWLWLMKIGQGDKDPESPEYGATPRQFIESLRVKNEKAQYVRFVLRPKQALLLALREEAWLRGEVFKAAVLKTRRYGITTFKLACAVERLLRVPGWIGLTVAKDDADAKKFMRTVREFINQIPEWMKPERVTGDKNVQGFRHGQFMESTLALLSANNDGGLGRGDTLNGLHATEPPHYRAKAKTEFSSVQPSLGDFEGNEELHESTANGHDAMFYPLWEEAHEVGEPAGSSDFVRVFIGAHEHPNFYRRFRTDAAMEEFMAKVGTEDRFGGRQELVYLHTLLLPYQQEEELPPACLGTEPENRSPKAARRRALEQLNYARSVQMDKCRRSFDIRCQEYPLTAREAFISTGSNFFNSAYVNGWMPHASLDADEQSVRGNFHYTRGRVVWKPDRDGLWVMRQPPQVGFSYCYGGDTASGKKKFESSGRSGDYSVTAIGEVATGFVACYLHGHLGSKEHAWETAKAIYYYGRAKGLIERAATGDQGTMITRLERMEIAGWCAYDSLLFTETPIQTDKGPRMDKKVGFRTTPQTKRPICTFLQDFFEVEVGDPTAGGIAGIEVEHPVKRCELPWIALDEMLYFEEDEKGLLEASKGHDDMIAAICGMLMARDQLLTNTALQSPVEVDEHDPEADQLELIYNSMPDGDRRGPGSLGRGF